MSAPRLLFLTLSTFSTTGGIEKVCRVAGKALQELATKKGGKFHLLSMYDAPADVLEQYVPTTSFTGHAGQRLRFVRDAVNEGRRSSHVLLSHINLLTVGFLIKLLSPNTKVLLIAHGIEVWVPLSSWKRWMLKKLDAILPVSEYTRQRMIELYSLQPRKLTVLNNCLDPFLTPSATATDIRRVREKYGLKESDKVLFTLARLSHSEQYKGYDKVIAALPELLLHHPSTKYLIAGRWDAAEKERLDLLIERLNLTGQVVFTGFVPEEEVASLFGLADLYVMPSTGEGFGIVFIEALFYGKPVIAGNKDGSVDALAGGAFGRLIDPDNEEELVKALHDALKGVIRPPILNDVLSKFGFETYKGKLSALLNEG